MTTTVASEMYTYNDSGRMVVEQIDMLNFARQHTTPFYVYSTQRMITNYRAFADAFAGDEPILCYSVKANPNRTVLSTFVEQGAGMDIVSIGEYRRARRAGCSTDRIVFSGVGKRVDEIDEVLTQGLLCCNIESAAEFELIGQRAKALGCVAPISVRVNPDVNANTHHKITTGLLENKFGVDFETAFNLYRRAKEDSHFRVVGVNMHIGSQIVTVDPYAKAGRELVEFCKLLRQEGHKLSTVDFGGGLGIAYKHGEVTPTPDALARVLRPLYKPLQLTPIFEIGRYFVADAGMLITQVLYIKPAKTKRFVVVDAAMNDLMRPALYEAYHEVVPLVQGGALYQEPSDLVGPVCESSDVLAKARNLPQCERGMYLALCDAGAYGASMASTYNSRQLPAEYMLNLGQWAQVSYPLTLEELFAREDCVQWQSASRTDCAN